MHYTKLQENLINVRFMWDPPEPIKITKPFEQLNINLQSVSSQGQSNEVYDKQQKLKKSDIIYIMINYPSGINSLAPERCGRNFKRLKKTQWSLGNLNEILNMYNFQMDFSDWWLRHLLWNCPNMNVTGLHWWSVNIGSGNGLVPSGNKPVPEPMLTQIYVVTWRH